MEPERAPTLRRGGTPLRAPRRPAPVTWPVLVDPLTLRAAQALAGARPSDERVVVLLVLAIKGVFDQPACDWLVELGERRGVWGRPPEGPGGRLAATR